jgi:hypothetical protein
VFGGIARNRQKMNPGESKSAGRIGDWPARIEPLAVCDSQGAMPRPYDLRKPKRFRESRGSDPRLLRLTMDRLSSASKNPQRRSKNTRGASISLATKPRSAGTQHLERCLADRLGKEMVNHEADEAHS